jgi:hypothetical protein
LRGIVRAEGWAEAIEAEAQRNPVAEPRHRQILGHTPSRIFSVSGFVKPAEAVYLFS